MASITDPRLASSYADQIINFTTDAVYATLFSNDENLNNAITNLLSTTLADGKIFSGNGSNVAAPVTPSGDVTMTNVGAFTVTNSAVINKVITGYIKAAGTVAATDTILEAVQKLDANDDAKADLISTPTNGNIVTTDGSGQSVDSGKKFNNATQTSADIWDAAKIVTFVAASTTGLYDDRGNYDASVNTFPATGGSGTAGAILKGDIWALSVDGTLGGETAESGDTVRALTDTPGQTAGNWAINDGNLGYTPENQTNKTDDVISNSTDTTKFPSAKGAYDAIATGAVTLTNKTIDSDNNTITNISNSDIKAAAGIVDTKLATITTADKVSGSAVQLKSGGVLANDSGLKVTIDTSLENVGGTLKSGDKQTAKTSGINATLTKEEIAHLGVSINATAGSLTFSIPAFVAGDDKFVGIIENSSATNSFTVDSADGYNIAGAASLVLPKNQSIRFKYIHATTEIKLFA